LTFTGVLRIMSVEGKITMHETELKPFTELRPGDRVLESYGIVTVERVKIQGEKATVYYTTQSPVTYHLSNWMEVIVNDKEGYHPWS
jgi:hypothetical protein